MGSGVGSSGADHLEDVANFLGGMQHCHTLLVRVA
jgi:hypothetical protein